MHLNPNFIKTFIKILKSFVKILIVLIGTGYITLQFPAVQTFIIQKITDSLSEKIDGEINIGRVHLVFFNKIIFKDISIVDTESTYYLDSLKNEHNFSDTLLSCRKLSVSLHSTEMLKLKVNLKNINLSNGVFNLQNEGGEGLTNLSRIFKIDRKKVKDTTKKGFPINLLANSLKITDFRFNLKNPNKYTDKGFGIINFADLQLYDINVDINDVRIERDTLFGNIGNIEASDHSGFRLDKLRGNLEVSAKEARINNLLIEDNYTSIRARYFYMRYNSSRDLSDFTNLVKMGIDLNETYFSFRTLARFSPSLSLSTLGLFINGEVSGPVCNLRSSDLEVVSESGQTLLNLRCRLSGLPDIKQTMLVADIHECHTTSSDVSMIISSINGAGEKGFLTKMSPSIKYNFKGTLMGLPDDFVAHGKLTSNVGAVKLDLLLRNDKMLNGFLIKGSAQTYDLNIGKIISNKLLGELSMKTRLSALMHKKYGPQLTIDTLRISKLGFNNYNYSNITALGEYNNQRFDGRIICHDPNLDFIFQGLFSFNTAASNRYNFYVDIPYANLSALNLDTRDSVSVLKTRTIANFTVSANNDIIGNINILNTTFTNGSGNYKIGTIKLNSAAKERNYTATVNAPFINAKYNGTAPFTSFIKKIKALALYEHAGDYFIKGSEKAATQAQEALDERNDFNLSVTTFNTGSICELLLPGSYIQDSTHIEAKIDTANIMDVKMLSGRVAIKHNYLKNLNLSINNRDSLLKLNLLSDNIRIAGMKLDSSSLSLKGRENLFDVNFGFKNDSTQNNRANIESKIAFQPKIIDFQIDTNSYITLKGETWNLQPSNIMLADRAVTIRDFALQNKNQNLTANGVLFGELTDSLSFNMNNFDVDIFNLFLNKPFNVKGLFSGKADISTYPGSTNILLDLTGDDVYVHNTQVGIMRILSRWDDAEERFKLLINTKLNGKSNLLITGHYLPKENYINLDGELNDLSVCYFEPFLSDVISKTDGTFSGNIKLSGTLDALKLEGENCRFDNFGFVVNYTQVPYTLNGPVSLNETGIFAKDLLLTDKFGNNGNVNGGLHYSYFKNPVLDTRISFRNLQCLQTSEFNNEAFYGSAFATGTFNIKGPFNNLALDINVTPAEKTALHIPLSSSYTATQTNILTFKEPERHIVEDPYEVMMRSLNKEQKAASQMQVKLRANMNPNAEMLIEINKSLGDIIKANGNGIVTLDINPSKDIFDIYGNYNINQGSYKFVLSGFGFASKDFIIQPGGSINFNGDISNTALNLTAIYRTKAAINTLIADTSSVSTRRNVNCEIQMSGNLMNPQLAFDIDIPDLDPTTDVKVQSALNTDEKKQKQFAAVLISGGFLPDEQSGITNNSTILYSNVSEMLSNQINNIFQQLGIPLDLGLNYQPGEKGTTDIFDVAVSTQLFNNRLLINGNIGNDPYASSSDNRGVIGNVDVEYKLDKSGRTRMAVFSHAADKYSNYLDDSQRSGIGISYQQEFNRIRDIFRKKSKEQKEYEKRMKEQQKAERKTERAERKSSAQSNSAQ